jgi:hypothetical protein
MDYLEQNDLLDQGRPTGRGALSPDAKMFRLETCWAVKTFIPPAAPENLIAQEPEWDDEFFPRGLKENPLEAIKREQRRQSRERSLARAREAIAGFGGLNIWFSDQHQTGPSHPQESDQLFLIVGFPKDDVNTIHAWSAYSAFTGLTSELAGLMAKTVLHSVADQSNNPTSKFQQSFLADPVNSLRSLGAQVAAPRKIRTLYRVRQAVLHKLPDDSAESIATIGYPIFIDAAGF